MKKIDIVDSLQLNDRIKLISNEELGCTLVTSKGWMSIMSAPSNTIICIVKLFAENGMVVTDDNNRDYVLLYTAIYKII